MGPNAPEHLRAGSKQINPHPFSQPFSLEPGRRTIQMSVEPRIIFKGPVDHCEGHMPSWHGISDCRLHLRGHPCCFVVTAIIARQQELEPFLSSHWARQDRPRTGAMSWNRNITALQVSPRAGLTQNRRWYPGWRHRQWPMPQEHRLPPCPLPNSLPN